MKKVIINFGLVICIFGLFGLTSILIYKNLSNLNLDVNFYTGVSAIATAIASIGGLILLLVTYLTFRETRKQRIAQEQPVITLRLIPDSKNSNLLNFSLKNTGGGPAYDINIHLTPDLSYGNSSLNNLSMFKNMSILESNEEITFFFDSAINYFSKNNPNPKEVKANITFYTLPKDTRGSKRLSRQINIKIDEREGQMQIIKKDVTDLVKEIEELKHAIIITKLNSGEKND